MQSFNVASATEANTLCFVSCFQEESFLLVFILYTKHPGISTNSKIFHIFIPSRNFLILQNQLHRAVIRSQNRCVDLRILQSVFQTFWRHKIINSPSSIFAARLEAVRPPGIDALLIRIKIPERIDKAILLQLCHLWALFIRKARVFTVGFRVL